MLCVSINYEMRKALVKSHIRGFRRRPEGVAAGLLLDLLFADVTSVLRGVSAYEHMLKVFVAVLLDPVKYLIVFHFHFLLYIKWMSLSEAALRPTIIVPHYAIVFQLQMVTFGYKMVTAAATGAVPDRGQVAVLDTR